jgi:hypothetical protein
MPAQVLLEELGVIGPSSMASTAVPVRRARRQPATELFAEVEFAIVEGFGPGYSAARPADFCQDSAEFEGY